MAGLHGGKEKTPNDAAYALLLALTVISFYASPVLLFGYVVAVIDRWRKRNAPQEPEEAAP